MLISLYGPPGAGKSALGRALAEHLGWPFADSDALIEARTGRVISQLFAERGEAAFRALEVEVCRELAGPGQRVVALGGGALLNADSRAALERRGPVVCLRAAPETLLARLGAAGDRPLLAGPDPAGQLRALLQARQALYASFPEQFDTEVGSPQSAAVRLAEQLAPRTLEIRAPGWRHVYRLGYGLLADLPALLAEHGLDGPAVIVADERVWQAQPDLGLAAPVIGVPPGEASKSLDMVERLCREFLRHGLDRGGVVIAVGGGVATDLAGFAAASYLRGVRWVAAPTSLLAMVDASLGGKTGVNLPEGKNLVGAFHPPALVAADLLSLRTLPPAEFRSGLAEVIKHGLISAGPLFEALEAGAAFGSLEQMERAVRVKAEVVERDPLERGERAVLNVGHTIGHGVEAASEYGVRHGEAVAIGLAAEARLAQMLGLADEALAGRIRATLTRAGLPVDCPALSAAAIRQAMQHDKKKAAGVLRFALLRAVGQPVWGVPADEGALRQVLAEIAGP